MLIGGNAALFSDTRLFTQHPPPGCTSSIVLPMNSARCRKHEEWSCSALTWQAAAGSNCGGGAPCSHARGSRPCSRRSLACARARLSESCRRCAGRRIRLQPRWVAPRGSAARCQAGEHRTPPWDLPSAPLQLGGRLERREHACIGLKHVLVHRVAVDEGAGWQQGRGRGRESSSAQMGPARRNMQSHQVCRGHRTGRAGWAVFAGRRRASTWHSLSFMPEP